MGGMNKDEILAKEPGRELDALVGRLVMGMDLVPDCLPQLPKYYLPEYEKTIFRDVPLYSFDISAAWEVVEKMSKEEYPLTMDNNHWTGHFDCGFYINDVTLIQVEAPNAPEAICKAALIALLERQWA